MKQTTLALAVTGVLAGTSLAHADSNVTIYGRANMDIENVRVSGASNSAQNIGSRNRVSSNSSYLGFRGTEDLGNGLQGWFQVESQINMDTGTARGPGDRNTAVGLKGSWGNLFLGRWDSPYKVAQVRFDPFKDVTIASEQNILGQASSTPSGDFHERTANAIQYWTPEFSGFTARIAYGTNEGKTATGSLNPSTWSGAILYDQAPFFAVAAYERHKDRGTLVAGARGRDTGKQAGFGVKLGSSKVGLIFERLEYATDAAGGSEFHRNAWFLGGEHSIDKITLRAYYAVAGDQKGSSAAALADSGAKAYSIGAAYDFSKRTQLFTSYTRINNERNATYEFGINPGPGLSTKSIPGGDPSGFLVGMQHLF